MNRIALEAVGVCKRYGNRDALRNVSLTACRGQLHGLVGPNGAGKTTLLRIVLGLVGRDAGSVRLFGKSMDSTAGPVPDRVAGFVETPAFYPYMSGRQNLKLLVRLDGTAGRRDAIESVLVQVGLAADADVNVAGYSAGLRQRLGLASALLRSPELLVLDEPTNALDPASARDVRLLAGRLAEQGAAVVWSSHDMAEVEDLCTEVTIVDGGRVAFSGSIEALRRLAPDTVHMLRTSDDRTAVALAAERAGLTVVPDASGEGLVVSGDIEMLDSYVIALGRSGIAVRALERRERSLETLFLQLTQRGGTARAQRLSDVSLDSAAAS
jgi:ABC-2 type transport system ATP-binding protein